MKVWLRVFVGLLLLTGLVVSAGVGSLAQAQEQEPQTGRFLIEAVAGTAGAWLGELVTGFIGGLACIGGGFPVEVCAIVLLFSVVLGGSAGAVAGVDIIDAGTGGEGGDILLGVLLGAGGGFGLALVPGLPPWLRFLGYGAGATLGYNIGPSKSSIARGMFKREEK